MKKNVVVVIPKVVSHPNTCCSSSKKKCSWSVVVVVVSVTQPFPLRFFVRFVLKFHRRFELKVSKKTQCILYKQQLSKIRHKYLFTKIIGSNFHIPHKKLH